MFKIGDIAHKLDIKPQNIYFYERIGLIPPPSMNPQGFRIFEAKDVERLLFIIRLKKLGMSCLTEQ